VRREARGESLARLHRRSRDGSRDATRRQKSASICVNASISPRLNSHPCRQNAASVFERRPGELAPQIVVGQQAADRQFDVSLGHFVESSFRECGREGPRYRSRTTLPSYDCQAPPSAR
jgi:hypothetical protein